jgi:hypothetical protein
MVDRLADEQCMDKVDSVISALLPEAVVQQSDHTLSKRMARKVESVIEIRAQRDQRTQSVGFSSRPFVLCGLPVKRPAKGQTVHERRNGNFELRIVSDPECGLPFGQDRLIPIWLATRAQQTGNRVIRFGAGAEILDAFGLPSNGRTYRRLTDGFMRIARTMFTFREVTDEGPRRRTRLEVQQYIRRMVLWETRDPDQDLLPGEDFQNAIELSEEFFREIQAHPIPCDMHVVRAFADSPATLDFYMWLSYRSFTARTNDQIALFGPYGLQSQLGIEGYHQRWKFRQSVRAWLAKTKAHWPECKATLSEDGDYLTVSRASAIRTLPKAVQLSSR